MTRRKLRYDVVLDPSDEGGFTVHVPALRGCVSEGDTEEEALENIKDAIACWLDTWQQIAKEKEGLIRQVEILR